MIEDSEKTGIFLKSDAGHGLTFRMWNTKFKFVRFFFDCHDMNQVADFNCNILWCPLIKNLDIFEYLQDFQWVNHFPYSFEISNKVKLFDNYQYMKGKVGEEYNFHPKSIKFPEQYEEFIQNLNKLKEKKGPGSK